MTTVSKIKNNVPYPLCFTRHSFVPFCCIPFVFQAPFSCSILLLLLLFQHYFSLLTSKEPFLMTSRRQCWFLRESNSILIQMNPLTFGY